MARSACVAFRWFAADAKRIWARLPVNLRIYKPVHRVEIAIPARLAFDPDQRPVIVFGHVLDAHFQRYLVAVPVGVVHDDFPVGDNIGHDRHMAQRDAAGRPKRHHRADNRFSAPLIVIVRLTPPVLGVAANFDAAEVSCVRHAPHPLPPGLLLRDLAQRH